MRSRTDVVGGDDHEGFHFNETPTLVRKSNDNPLVYVNLQMDE
jgi:hypothetical protein